MLTLNTTDDILRLTESHDLECKLAAGRDHQGAVPHSFWETYSAMANTDGGYVLLGVKEKKGKFSVQGLANPQQVHKDLIDTANNPQKVSVNLLSNDSVEQVTLEGKTFLQILFPEQLALKGLSTSTGIRWVIAFSDSTKLTSAWTMSRSSVYWQSKLKTVAMIAY